MCCSGKQNWLLKLILLELWKIFFGNSMGLYWLIYGLKTDFYSVLAYTNRHANVLFLTPSLLELHSSRKKIVVSKNFGWILLFSMRRQSS